MLFGILAQFGLEFVGDADAKLAHLTLALLLCRWRVQPPAESDWCSETDDLARRDGHSLSSARVNDFPRWECVNLEDAHPAQLDSTRLDQVVGDQLEETLEVSTARANGEPELPGQRIGKFLLGSSHGEKSSGRV